MPEPAVELLHAQGVQCQALTAGVNQEAGSQNTTHAPRSLLATKCAPNQAAWQGGAEVKARARGDAATRRTAPARQQRLRQNLPSREGREASRRRADRAAAQLQGRTVVDALALAQSSGLLIKRAVQLARVDALRQAGGQPKAVRFIARALCSNFDGGGLPRRRRGAAAGRAPAARRGCNVRHRLRATQVSAGARPAARTHRARSPAAHTGAQCSRLARAPGSVESSMSVRGSRGWRTHATHHEAAIHQRHERRLQRSLHSGWRLPCFRLRARRDASATRLHCVLAPSGPGAPLRAAAAATAVAARAPASLRSTRLVSGVGVRRRAAAEACVPSSSASASAPSVSRVCSRNLGGERGASACHAHPRTVRTTRTEGGAGAAECGPAAPRTPAPPDRAHPAAVPRGA